MLPALTLPMLHLFNKDIDVIENTNCLTSTWLPLKKFTGLNKRNPWFLFSYAAVLSLSK